MKYTVYEDGERAEIKSFGEGWNATRNSRREAEVYAYMWCVPVTREEAEKSAPEMEVGKRYDYNFGHYNEHVWMHIEEEQ